MKCQRCKEREANVQIMQQSPGKMPQTFMLCDVCARELGISLPSFPVAGKALSNPFVTLSNIFQASIGLGNDEMNETPVSRCSQCNMTFDNFKKTGFLGCPHCYEAFASKMDPVFMRTQMGKKHEGRRLGVKSVKGHSDEALTETSRGIELSETEEGHDPARNDTAGVTDSDGSRGTGDVTSEAKTINKPAKKRKLSERDAGMSLSETQEINALEKKHLEELIANNKTELSAAIAAEDYSTAAKLRDVIAELSKKKMG